MRTKPHLRRFRRASALLLAAGIYLAGHSHSIPPRGAFAKHAEPAVALLRTPDDGIQPQAVAEDRGALHLIYFRGEAGAGDVYYVRRPPGQRAFSAPLRVNSQPGSVIATGNVRGAHLAIGKGGRVHVAWMGSRIAEPKGPAGATPMLYARLNDAGTAFEPQRNVMQFAEGLDGGGSVAADEKGRVYVAWHGRGEVPGEAHRRVYLARSTDEGRSFARETPASLDTTGACGCCGMRAFADRQGALYMLYRAATDFVDRDIRLLTSSDEGRHFQDTRLHPWKLDTCPMSTATFAESAGRILSAWETAGQVYFAVVRDPAAGPGAPIPAPGEGKLRKHPALAVNANGETLLVWTEGMGWKKGGTLAWQIFDRNGRPTGAAGTAPGVPVWSLPTAIADDRGFTIVY